MPTTATQCHIRWMVRSDIPAVLEIERDVFEIPWREQDFVRHLRRRECVAMSALHGNELVGYMIYELHKSRLHLLNLAVARQHWRHGIGAAMIDKLRGEEITAEVGERNLPAQKFFRAMGFRCVNTLHGFYDGFDEDALLFRLDLPTKRN